MINFHWVKEKKYPPYRGYCPQHGEWENWINDICVYEDWVANRKGKEEKKPKQDKMLIAFPPIFTFERKYYQQPLF